MKTNTKMLLCMTLALAGTFAHAQVLRPYTGGDTTTWSSGGSWASGVPLTGDDVSYRNTATGTNIFDLASGFTIRNLGVGARNIDSNGAATSVTTTLDLNNRTLNATGLYVGRNITGSGTTWLGNLTLSDGTFHLANGRIEVGVRTGNTTSAHANGTVTGTSSLNFSATGMTAFHVGTTDHQGGYGVGTIDFTNVASGTLSVSGAGTATDRVIIGGRLASGSGGHATGTVTLGDNWTATTFGTSTTERTNMLVAFRSGNATTSGTFTQSGGTFDAFLGGLNVGQTFSGDTPTVTGTVNLTGAISNIDVNTMRIATQNTNHTGTVTIGVGDVLVNTSATIGGGTKGTLNLNRTDFAVASGAILTLGTTGEINSTIGSVSGGIDIANTAVGALVISNSATIASGRGLEITFAENPLGLDWVATAGEATDIFYGFKWAGDHVSALNSSITAGSFDWNDSALTGQFANKVDLFYDSDSDATYVGFYAIPEPSTLLMLGLFGSAMAVVGLKRRK